MNSPNPPHHSEDEATLEAEIQAVIDDSQKASEDLARRIADAELKKADLQRRKEAAAERKKSREEEQQRELAAEKKKAKLARAAERKKERQREREAKAARGNAGDGEAGGNAGGGGDGGNAGDGDDADYVEPGSLKRKRGSEQSPSPAPPTAEETAKCVTSSFLSFTALTVLSPVY